MTEPSVLILILVLMLLERIETSKHTFAYCLVLGWVSYKLIYFGIL